MRLLLRCLLSAFYVTAGIVHLRSPDPFLLIIPDFVPHPREVVLVTGMLELLGALGLFLPRIDKLAGAMLALYAVCVFPANIKHAIEGIDVPGLPSGLWYHAPRFLLQPLLVWTALFCVRLVDWPFRARHD